MAAKSVAPISLKNFGFEGVQSELGTSKCNEEYLPEDSFHLSLGETITRRRDRIDK